MSLSLIWFRQDLRLYDNPALTNALKKQDPILFLYLYEENIGSAAKWWLHHSLKQLAKSLESLGATLIYKKGEAEEVITSLIKKHKISTIYSHQPISSSLKEKWADLDCLYEETEGNFLSLPGSIVTGKGSAYKVFTPYMNAFLKEAPPRHPIPAPVKLPKPPFQVPSLTLDDLSLLPKGNWAENFSSHWTPGEQGALNKLALFKKKVATYAHDREIPSIEGTSRLSPHLHFGEISPFTIFHSLPKDSFPYVRQLIWREFAASLLHFFPETTHKPLNSAFQGFPWKKTAHDLKKWQKGLTGYPIVDAGMRELWQTGWMHNRVRMIVSSFLIKDLGIHWVKGAEWFLDTLLDADLANNTFGWQWAAGCGADSAPYYRIFNPVLQGEKFDPEGDYIKKYVPELKHVPSAWIHHPWQAPSSILEQAHVVLGKTYPHPIVDHQKARLEALDIYYKFLKKS